MSTSSARLARGAVLASLLLAGCDELGLGAAPPKAPPRLAFAQTAYDFGRVPQGTPVEHHFTFVNEGDSPLTVIDLRAACDCQVALLGGDEIAPRAAGAVQGRFDTDAVYGPQRRTITVYSNDPDRRVVVLTLIGEVALDVAADPPQVYLGTVPPGVAMVREVAVRSGNDGVHIGMPQSDSPHLSVRLGDGPDASAAAILAIGTAATAPAGPFTAEVRVPTTSATHPVVRVAVSGTIDPAAPTPRAPAIVPPGVDGNATGTAPDQEAR